MPRNPTWSRDELILALDLYRRIGTKGSDHPEVIKLSRLLNDLNKDPLQPDPERFRNSNGVAMKLANFARFDPSYRGTGLSRGGAMEAEIWSELADDPTALAREVATIRRRLN